MFLLKQLGDRCLQDDSAAHQIILVHRLHITDYITFGLKMQHITIYYFQNGKRSDCALFNSKTINYVKAQIVVKLQREV